VINQWKHRCTSGSVAKPLAYLTSLAGKAIRGDFNAEWSPSALAPTPMPPAARAVARTTQSPAPKPTPTAMQTANSALTSLQALLDPRRRGEPTDE